MIYCILYIKSLVVTIIVNSRCAVNGERIALTPLFNMFANIVVRLSSACSANASSVSASVNGQIVRKAFGKKW